MSADSSAGQTNTSTATIYLIRDGEKPPTKPQPHGVKSVDAPVDGGTLTTLIPSNTNDDIAAAARAALARQ
jgi:hypothetical protein